MKISSSLNYPIKFYPRLKQKIWGGEKLKKLLNKETEKENVGESWEISGVDGNISIVKNGSEKGNTLKYLIQEYKEDLVGKKIYREFGSEFPLLIKFIDASQNLSVQVHPNDKLARSRHNSFGKTEMWYVLQADKESKLNIGFNKNIDKEVYLNSLKEEKIEDLLHYEEVSKGDSIFIDTGTVHAIGKGVLLAEIQQTSDITYRIYDWNRKDDKGNSRELHTKLALDAINFKKNDGYKLSFAKKKNQSANIISCKYFTINILTIKGNLEMDYSSIDSFIIYMCIEGTCTISTSNNSETIQIGETILIPACNNQVKLVSESCELLEVYIS